MKLLSLVLILCFTLVSCTGDNTSTVSNEVLTGILTLETTFGNNEDGDEKYLLAQPYGLVVDDNMNIIIPDESSLKVFDLQGNPKTILGGPGQGPNEFDSPYVLYNTTFHPTSGTLIAQASSNNAYNIYDENLKFLQKKTIMIGSPYDKIKKDLELRRMRVWQLLLLDNDEFLFSYRGSSNKSEGNLDRGYQGLIYENIKEPVVIMSDSHPSFIVHNNGGMAVPYQGSLHYSLLTDNLIAYSSSANDITTRNGENYYQITLSSTKGDLHSTSERKFTKVALPDTLPTMYKRLASSGNSDTLEKIELVKQFLLDNPYFPSISKLLTDSNYIFAFTYSKNESGETLTNVFDGDTGNYLRSVYFPFIPRAIKNGKAFHLKTGADIFPSVEVYSIDEKVYAK